MPKPKTNEEILAQQTRELERAQKKKRRYDRQSERNREKKQKYDSGSGHGVAVLFDEKPAESSSEYNRALENERKRRASQLSEAEASRDKAKEEAKNTKDAMKESKRRMVGDKIKNGKGIGLVVFNEKGCPVDASGRPLKDDPTDHPVKDDRKGKGSKRIIVDDERLCNPSPKSGSNGGKPRNPMSYEFSNISCWGHVIDRIYKDADGRLYAVARKDGKTTWAKGYNLEKGTWTDSDKDLTQRQIDSRSRNMTLIVDNMGGA